MNPQHDNSFLATMQRHEGGAVLSEMSSKLAEIVRAVSDRGGKGTVTLKLEVAHAARGKSALVLTHEVTTKAPKERASGSFWYSTDSGALVKNDPNQKELQFKDGPVGPVVFTGGAGEAPAKPTTETAVNQ